MKPHEATVIHPEMFDKEKNDHDDLEICCDGCDIEYTLTDYKILKDNKKLLYFLYEDFLICHACLFREISKSIPEGGETRLKILDYSQSYYLNFGDEGSNIESELE